MTLFQTPEKIDDPTSPRTNKAIPAFGRRRASSRAPLPLRGILRPYLTAKKRLSISPPSDDCWRSYGRGRVVVGGPYNCLGPWVLPHQKKVKPAQRRPLATVARPQGSTYLGRGIIVRPPTTGLPERAGYPSIPVFACPSRETKTPRCSHGVQILFSRPLFAAFAVRPCPVKSLAG
jgi:hypothetical protein